MKYILIQTDPLKLSSQSVGGLPRTISRVTPPPATPNGYAYVEDQEFPAQEPSAGKQWARNLTAEAYGWIEQDAPEQEPEWYELTAWRIRTVAKLTPFGDGVLMDSVDLAIAAIADPAEKAVAEEVFYHGNTLRRDSVLLTTMATGLGIDDLTLDGIFEQAYAIEV
jgi:hypothetical protein